MNNNWKFEILSVSDTGVGGYKEAHANIVGGGAFGKSKFESGVHRVQRVPVTETNGRRTHQQQLLLFYLRLRM